MRQSDGSSKVTLEDLLHLKRAERPDQAFWAEFDRTLREKQLAALVGRRRGWTAFYRSLLRIYAPAGAAAVALGSLALWHFDAPQAAPQAVLAATLAEAEVTPVFIEEAPDSGRAPEPVLAVASAAPVVPKQNQALAIRLANAGTPRDDSGLAASAPASPPVASFEADSGAIEELYASLGQMIASQFRETERELSNAAQRFRVRNERLADIFFASEQERSPAVEPGANVRFSRYLADAALQDDFRRLDLNGSAVSIKF